MYMYIANINSFCNSQFLSIVVSYLMLSKHLHVHVHAHVYVSNFQFHCDLVICILSQASFGFITCCERNESIFFHFSQFGGDPTELQLGGKKREDGVLWVVTS